MRNRWDDRRRGAGMEWNEDRWDVARERGYGGADWGRPRNLGARDHGPMYGMTGGRQPEVPGWGRGMGGSDLGMGAREMARGPFYAKGPKGYRRSDERIREDVCECIHMQGHIDASDVEIKVENGIVTMTGTVPERQMKRMLERMVEGIRGVEDVHNELRLPKREEERRPSQTNDNPKVGPQYPNGRNARS